MRASWQCFRDDRKGVDDVTMHCHSEDRICADYVVMSRQRTKDRVKVILVAEELGY